MGQAQCGLHWVGYRCEQGQCFSLIPSPLPLPSLRSLDQTLQPYFSKSPSKNWISTEYNIKHPGEYRLTCPFAEELQIYHVTFKKIALIRKILKKMSRGKAGQ